MGEIAKRENLMKFKTVVDLGEKKNLDGLRNVVSRNRIVNNYFRYAQIMMAFPKNEINSALRLVTTTSVVFIHIRFTKNSF